MEPLIHLALIWVFVYVAVIMAGKTRLTPVLYFLAAGSFLVNVDLLPEHTHPFIEGLAELGIILIMFALGFEENSHNFIQGAKRSWGIAVAGASVPFAAAYIITDYFWNDSNISLMCALAIGSSTAVSLTMVSLKSEGLQKTPAATGIITSAIMNDIASLALIAVLLPIASGTAAVSAAGILMIVAKIILFFITVIIIGACIFPHNAPHWFKRFPIIGRYGIRHVLSFEKGEYATLSVLLIALLIGLLSHYMGFHPAVGAYMAGLIMTEEYFHFGGKKDAKHYNKTKSIIENAAFSWIGPVFFVYLGSQIVFDWEIFASVIPEAIILTIGIFIAQVAASAAAAYYTAKFDRANSLLIGFGMLGRAELAFVVMGLAYVEFSILTTEAFYTLMATAFCLNVSVPVTISLWKKKMGTA